MHVVDRLRYDPPKIGSDPAYDAAMSILESEKSSVRQKIDACRVELEQALAAKAKAPEDKDLTKKIAHLELKIRNLNIDIGFTDLFNHYVFNGRKAELEKVEKLKTKFPQLSEVDPAVFEAMKRRRFESYVVPKLVKTAERFNLFVDAFPSKILKAMKPEINVEVNFPNTQWEGCFGHAVPPNWALYSPTITLSSTNPNTQYYTLLLADLDRPNLDTRSYEEWCHWLVTDIPVTGRLVIPGGSSPFLGRKAAPQVSAAERSGFDYHPPRPGTPPEIPGNVVLPYVPPHPPNSNPRRLHRYVLYAFRQPKQGVTVDWAETAKAVEARYSGVDKKKPFLKSVYGEAEQKLQVRERGLFPAWKFKTDHNMSLAGFAFFTSSYNLHTSDIYSRLGIHEPVYGELRQVPSLVNKIQIATAVATDLASKGPLSSLSATDLAPLNTGVVAPPRLPRRTTRRMIEAEKSKEAWEAKDATKKIRAKALVREGDRKIPRVTTIGSVGIVRAKEGDVAGKVVGEVTKKIMLKPYRYKNV
ncbi:MFT2-Corn MFT-like protein [Dinochytrium kinnereticum]|nr:MFT2-Corn MFT-like protein [Dinochytrium kinnereticum]